MPHDAYAQSVGLWSMPYHLYAEHEPEYLRLQGQNHIVDTTALKGTIELIINLIQSIGPPPDSAEVAIDPATGEPFVDTTVPAGTTAPATIVGAAALPPGLVEQPQQPAPPPAATVPPPPAEVFQYVDRKGVLHTFNNQYDLNTHRKADEKAAAAEEEQKLIDEKETGGGEISDVVTGKGTQGFSAFNPFTQRLEYFATQADADAAKRDWEIEQEEAAKSQTFSVFNDYTGEWEFFNSEKAANDRRAGLTAEANQRAGETKTKTFSGYNAVTGKWETGFSSQGAATNYELYWETKKKENDEAAAAAAVVTTNGTGAIDQVLELGTGDEPMAAWEDWSTAFGAYSPEQQYNALMRQQLPQYGIPGYGQMAQQQFAPTFGRFLMSGYGDDPKAYGLGAGQGFENWFGGQMGRRPDVTTGTGKMPWDYSTAYPTTGTQTGNLKAGWQLAQQFGALQPESTVWDQLMGQNLGMGYAMTQPDAIQAMAQSQYYGGGGPVGGYAGRAVASGLSGLYDRWMQRQLAGSGAAPAAFLPYLSSLSKSRWPTLETAYEYVAPEETTTSGTGVITPVA